MQGSRLWLRLGAQAGVLVVAIVLAGCGGDDEEAAAPQPAPATTEAAGASAIDEFNATIEQEFAELTGTRNVPVPESGPPAATGKKVVIIPCTAAAEGCSRPAEGGVEAAKAIGWEPLLIDGKGDPSVQAAAIERAISIGADGISITAIDSRNILGALEQAKEAGIKIVCYYCEDAAGVYDHRVVTPETIYDQGRAAAVAAYSLSDQDMKIIVMEDPEFSLLENRTKAIEDFVGECQQAGGDCEVVAKKDFLVNDLQTIVPNLAATLARQNPEWTVITGPYGSAIPFIAQGLREAGLANPPKIAVGYDSDGANIELMRTGDFYVADVGLANPAAGWIQIDNLNRLFAGEPPSDAVPPNKLLTDENVPAEGAWDGDNNPQYKDDFKGIWGVG